MLRTLFLLVSIAVAGYCVFYVPIEGRPIAAHVRDVWHSALVQEKVKLVARKLRFEIEPTDPMNPKTIELRKSRPHAAAERGRRAQPGSGPREEHNDTDRQSLDALVNDAQKQ